MTVIINKSLNGDYFEFSDIVVPPNPELGDLCIPCFKIGKALGLSPIESAGKIMEILSKEKMFAGVSTAGPYLNLKFAREKTAKEILAEIIDQPKDYGKNESGKKKKVMIEFSNANTHKEYHVGHLRNLAYGDAVARILDANGYTGIPVSYINDFGIHVAKTLWCYEEYHKEEHPVKNKGFFLGKLYTQSTTALKDNEEGRRSVSMLMQKIETRRGKEYELWRTTRQWSIEQFDNIYHELDISFKTIFYESEFIERGKDLVGELYSKEILRKSEGAIIADLEKYGLGVLVVMRSDGTALYPVADIPLAMEKFDKYGLDKSIYVVDIRQSLYFKQLSKLLEILGYKKPIEHLGYEFVKLPSGMMSSRSGNVITYEDLKSELLEKATAETKTRHQDWSPEKIEETARKIAFGAIKFEMVKVGRDSVITFDIESALKFEGFTSAYLQYTCARISSIQKKAGSYGSEKNFEKYLSQQKEHELIVRLCRFPDAVEAAGKNYDPSEIAKYLFDLAQSFNDYYHKIQILKAEEKIKNSRLMLISAVKNVLSNGLQILGIKTLDEM